MTEIGVPHHREVVLQARSEPHDVGRVPEIPSRLPLVVQRGDSATDEVGPDHLEGEPGHGEAMDPSGSDREFLVVGIEVAPVPVADRWALTNPAELLGILLLNLQPAAPPLFPPLLLGALQTRPLLLGPWDPSDKAGDGAPCLDAGIEIVAEKRHVGEHSGEALAEVGEKGHARHGIWREI